MENQEGLGNDTSEDAKREQRLAKKRAYYQANKDRVKAKYQENREERNAKRRVYRQENPDKVRAQGRACKAKDREKQKARCREWYHANKERQSAYFKARNQIPEHRDRRNAGKNAWYQANRARERAKRLGVCPEEYRRADEADRCAICKTPFSLIRGVIDHCHKTGRVRGKLCRQCNTALGGFRDDLKLLRRAVKYLADSSRKPRSRESA